MPTKFQHRLKINKIQIFNQQCKRSDSKKCNKEKQQKKSQIFKRSGNFGVLPTPNRNRNPLFMRQKVVRIPKNPGFFQTCTLFKSWPLFFCVFFHLIYKIILPGSQCPITCIIFDYSRVRLHRAIESTGAFVNDDYRKDPSNYSSWKYRQFRCKDRHLA